MRTVKGRGGGGARRSLGNGQRKAGSRRGALLIRNGKERVLDIYLGLRKKRGRAQRL